MSLILVIDDHKDKREILQKVLERRGHQTRGSETAEAALATFVSEKPNLIIVDGMMPGMNGIEFIRLVRANVDTATIPIILYTAISDQTFLDNATEKGPNDIFIKGNVDLGDVVDRVTQYVS